MDTVLPGNYVAGFVDGEGCFSLKFRKDIKHNSGNKKIREYFYWGVEFAIVLRTDDLYILELIKNTLNCGRINNSTDKDQVRFSVQNSKDLMEKIIPFFKKYPLRAKKSHDFQLWVRAVEIIDGYRDGHVNIKKGYRGFTKKNIKKEDIKELFRLRSAMLEFKSKREKSFRWEATAV